MTSPGNSPFALTVGAVDDNNEWACFSGGQTEPSVKPDVVAPGVDVTVGNASFSGTSFSTAFAAGASALMLQANPSLTPYQVKKIWRESALGLGQEGADEKYGWGLLNVSKALQAAAKTENLSLEDFLKDPHFGGENFSTKVDISTSNFNYTLNISIRFIDDMFYEIDFGNASDDWIYALGVSDPSCTTGAATCSVHLKPVWDSTQSTCGAFHQRVDDSSDVSPAYGFNGIPSMDYCVEKCGKAGAFICSFNYADLTFKQCNYKGLQSNMCSSCSFYQTIQNTCSGSPTPTPTPPPGIRCYSNSDCGSNGFLNSPYCSSGSVYDTYRSYYCINAGTTSSYCTNSDSSQLKQTCTAPTFCSGGACITPTPTPTPSAKPDLSISESDITIEKV